VAEKVKAMFLWPLCNHNRVISVQFPSSSHTMLRPWIRRFTMIISAWWLRTSRKLSGKMSKKKRKTRKWKTPKRVRIRPKYSATVAFL